MDITKGPITYSRRLTRESPRRAKGAPLAAAIAGLALIVHASAGLTVFRTAEAVETPVAMIVAPPAPSPAVELAAELTPLEDAVAALLAESQALTASFELRPAMAPPPDDLRPAIAVIIDDVGLSAERTRRVIDLPVPITLSFLPYGEDVQMLADEAGGAGHEVFLHLPMEPVGTQDPGPDALLTGLDHRELMARAAAALDSFTGYTGVNNHMGSRLTQNAGMMAEVMTLISARDLSFVDSLTSPRSVAYQVAAAHGIDAARRDVFLDNDIDDIEIIMQLMEAERIAREQGTAIAIAHPHEQTLLVLQTWLETLGDEGFDIVPVSEIIRRRSGAEILVARN